MDAGAIQALIASLKTATEVAKAIFDMKTNSEVRSKVSEIQSALLSAQNSALSATTAQFELRERVRELEAQLKAVNDWEAQKSRYCLVAPWQGAAQAYALRESLSQGEAPHLLCANCFQSSRRAILNPQRDKEGWVVMVCPSCKATLYTGFYDVGGPLYAEGYLEQAKN